MKDPFYCPLTDLAGFEEICDRMRDGRGPVQASGCVDAQKAQFICHAAKDLPWKLVIAEDAAHADRICEDIKSFGQDAWLYPARDLLFYSADIHGNLITRQRMEVLRALEEEAGGVVVAPAQALLDRMMPAKKLWDRIIPISAGDEVDTERLCRQFAGLGYERVAMVDGMGQYAVRGGIIDIYPLTMDAPCRIELFGDEVDSLRLFDIESQRSIKNLDMVIIYPASEVLLSDADRKKGAEAILADGKKCAEAFKKQQKTEAAYKIERYSADLARCVEEGENISRDTLMAYFCDDFEMLSDYMPKDKTLFVADEPVRILERAREAEAEFSQSMALRAQAGELLPRQQNLLFGGDEILKRLPAGRTMYLTGISQKLGRYGIDCSENFFFEVRSMPSYAGNTELMLADISKRLRQGCRVVILTDTAGRAERLAEKFRGEGLPAISGTSEDRPAAGQILLLAGAVSRGFEYPQIKFCLLTEVDMFGRERKKKKRRAADHRDARARLSGYDELSVGEYCIHEEHGVGIYRGIEKIEQGGVIRDFVKIEYDGGANLFFPASKLGIVQKYTVPDGKKVRLNSLGTEQWNRTKARVKSAVQNIAKDLVELYAERLKKQGRAYAPDTPWQKEFEEGFPFEETEDQLAAIEDTKRDMESGRIMDRLICGDVGFGKTEIAIRAAFKAVQESRQVAYLVPTTILAQQHFTTFCQRMKDYPVKIALISRFRSDAQIKQSLKDLAEGRVDIVIGTHRLLSRDVIFKDLGLLIIDEEQRFGVAHKELIKKLKTDVDVLTLTATPIPRTLHMSMSGIRDMSLLQEPPMDRVPIQTYVMEYNEELVRESISRELARGGQVYFVYNRVNDIADMAGRIKKLMPQAEVAYAHGQMRENQLEEIMLDFVNGETDVLVATTIIETGLDIQNVNTIIIYDADRMGLSQLYQLRGRVGRSNRTAYAFLLYKRDKVLSEVAEKRLRAIKDFTELGSGVRIAMRDLEIRGAGNVLGAEQHGHMEAVGYDLYCKLLRKAVQCIKDGGSEKENRTAEVLCRADAYIPAAYIPDEMQKLDVYKRISQIESETDYSDMQDELTDRYGDMPQMVENLLNIAYVKALGSAVWACQISVGEDRVETEFFDDAPYDPAKLAELIAAEEGNLRLSCAKPPRFLLSGKKYAHAGYERMLGAAAGFLKKLPACLKEGQKKEC